jgi:hypothetical protein
MKFIFEASLADFVVRIMRHRQNLADQKVQKIGTILQDIRTRFGHIPTEPLINQSKDNYEEASIAKEGSQRSLPPEFSASHRRRDSV